MQVRVAATFKMIAGVLLAVVLGGCVFDQPVLTSGLSAPQSSWAGLWKNKPERDGDSCALLVPLGGKKWLLEYPRGTSDSWLFEVSAATCRGRTLLQLRTLCDNDGKLSSPGGKNYTVVWVEPRSDGSMNVRTLDMQAVTKKGLTAQGLRRFLFEKESDWSEVFSAEKIFRRP